MANKGMTPERFDERQVRRRNAAAFESFSQALAVELDVPPPVTEIVRREPGKAPLLPPEAFELARQVYYLQHGTRADAARAVIAAGLSDTDSEIRVYERLKTWWQREGWPVRSTEATFAIRDAGHDGGLYRSGRRCKALTTGSGPAPEGKPCGSSPLDDSDYCHNHDPRPEWVARRRREGERLAEARNADMVPLEPFQRWCDVTRRRLLKEACANGAVHPNNQGWNLLAERLCVSGTVLYRIRDGSHSPRRRGEPKGEVDKLRAATVIRYLEHFGDGTTFQDVYGFDPPPPTGQYNVCPRCGGYKAHESVTCRDCYEAEGAGVECAYVDRNERKCTVLTSHESGYCHKHRRIVFRVRKPSLKGVPRADTYLTPTVLLHAIDEYRREPVFAWVARRVWAADIDGVAGRYTRRSGFTSALVKRWRLVDWHDPEKLEAAYAELLAEHGPVRWPEDGEIAAGGLVPPEPFRAWLRARYAEAAVARAREGRGVRGLYKEFAERLGLNDDYISQMIRGTGRGAHTRVKRSTIDRALAAWGDGMTYDDLRRQS